MGPRTGSAWLAGAVVALALSGCTTPVAVSGLRPESPAAVTSPFPHRPRSDPMPWAFVEVDSLQPTLRWEPFPRPADLAADPAGPLSRLGAVTYDLRIWRADGAYPADLVYARAGLPAPSHTLEAPLEPAARYFWTIRARFELHGETRVSEWGTYAPGRTRALVPSPFYYRFRTPGR